MNHTFTKQEYKEFIGVICHSKEYEEELKYIEEIYNSSVYWEKKLSGINHFLSIVLEQFAKRDIETSNIIELIYSLPDLCNFEIQESSERFIDSLYDDIINPNLTLEEQLILVQNRIS